MTKPKKIKGDKVGVHLSPEIREALEVRASDQRGPSATLAQAFLRYAQICQRVNHGLDEHEIEVCAVVLDGVGSLTTSEIAMLPNLILHCAADRGIVLPTSVESKLGVLSIAQRVSLADALERSRR